MAALIRRSLADMSGYTFVELIVTAALIVVIAGAAVPQLLTTVDRSNGLAAARYLAARMAQARMQSVARSAAVGLRFEDTPHGVAFAVFVDGNANGVRSRDIEGGIDRLLDPATRLGDLFAGAGIALAPHMPGSGPVQIGGTSILSFTPAGTASSGTVYVLGRDGTQWAVRVLGATGRTRVLRCPSISSCVPQ